MDLAYANDNLRKPLCLGAVVVVEDDHVGELVRVEVGEGDREEAEVAPEHGLGHVAEETALGRGHEAHEDEEEEEGQHLWQGRLHVVTAAQLVSHLNVLPTES